MFIFTIGAAFKPLIGGIILKEQTSFYTYPGRYASEHGELEQYRAVSYTHLTLPTTSRV